MADNAAATGVQSVERAFNLLEYIAEAGDALTLSELASVSRLPMRRSIGCSAPLRRRGMCVSS